MLNVYHWLRKTRMMVKTPIWNSKLGKKKKEGDWDQDGGSKDEEMKGNMCLLFDKRDRLTQMDHKHFLSPSQVQAEDTEGRGCSAWAHREQSHVTSILGHGRICNFQNAFHSIRCIQAITIARTAATVTPPMTAPWDRHYALHYPYHYSSG